MIRIAHVFTSSKFVPFVRPLLLRLAEAGYESHVISGPGPELDELGRAGIFVHPLAMSRTIDPWSDLISLIRLRARLAAIRPALLHCHTPKGGLLGVVAGASLGLGPRIYQMHGSPWISSRGLKKALFWLTEAISSRLAQETIVVSGSLRAAGERARFLRRNRAILLGAGSAYGVDVERFRRSPPDDSAQGLRAKLGIGPQVKVLGFAGRYIEEKGLAELRVVIQAARARFPDARLLLAGAVDGAPPRSLSELLRCEGVTDLGFQADMPAFYQALDLFLLPSHREGLSTVLLEAMASGVAAMGSSTIGIVDVIDHGRTGYLVPPQSAALWAEGALELLSDDGLRSRLAEAGSQFVRETFRTEDVVAALLALYSRLGAAASKGV